MSLEIICPHCGATNNVGKIFCGSCGGNMQAGRKPPKMRTKKQPGKSPAHALWMLIKLIMVAAIVALIVGVFSPVSSTVDPGNPDQGAAYDNRARQISLHIGKIQAGQVADPRFQASFREYELNGKLAAFLDSQEQAEGTLALRINSLTIDLDDGFLIMHMDTSTLNDKLRLTYRMVVEPVAGENGFSWKVTRAQIGKIPFPGPLKDMVVSSKFAAIFKYAELEQSVLKHVVKAAISSDNAIQLFLDVK